MTTAGRTPPLRGKVALVAGATRGAGRAIAVELARAGAFVYATGRSSRVSGPSEVGRPETIEETGELITAAGGAGTALRVDHLDPGQVSALTGQIGRDHGRLDVLVNDIFDGGRYAEFETTLWEHDLAGGLRMLRIGIDTHAITSHFALPLLIGHPGGLVVEMTDGTAEYNAAYRHHEGFYYDLVKAAVQRMTLAQAHELRPHQASAVAVTPGWMAIGRHARLLRRDRGDLARGHRPGAALLHLGITGLHRASGHRARGRSGRGPLFRAGGVERAAGPRLRVHRYRREPGRTAGDTWSRSRTRTFQPTIAVTADRLPSGYCAIRARTSPRTSAGFSPMAPTSLGPGASSGPSRPRSRCSVPT